MAHSLLVRSVFSASNLHPLRFLIRSQSTPHCRLGKSACSRLALAAHHWPRRYSSATSTSYRYPGASFEPSPQSSQLLHRKTACRPLVRNGPPSTEINSVAGGPRYCEPQTSQGASRDVLGKLGVREARSKLPENPGATEHD